MHSFFFDMKRAHLRSVVHQTRFLKGDPREINLTPARFDLLHALRRARSHLWQSDLRRRLGVSRATICKMLKALERLGIVERRPAARDTRQRVVAFTVGGLALFKRAARRGCRRAGRLLVRAISEGRRHLFVPEAEVLERYLRRMRAGLGDTATFVQPWHPDD